MEHHRGRPTGSMNCIDNPTRRELSSEILAAYLRAGAGAGAGAGVPVETIYRRQIEAAAPDPVLTAPRRALRSPTSTSQLRTILKVVF